MNSLIENKKYSIQSNSCLLKRGKRSESHALLERKSHKI